MSLTHRTETLVIVALSLFTAAVGVLLASVPALPSGFLPWLIVTLFAVGYVLLVLPFLRARAASSFLVWLHVLPIVFCVLWFLAQLLHKGVGTHGVASLISWKNSSIFVIPALLLTMWYAVVSLRRVLLRVLLGAAVLGAFVMVSFWPGRLGPVDQRLAAMLWTPSVRIANVGTVASSVSSASISSKSAKSLASSAPSSRAASSAMSSKPASSSSSAAGLLGRVVAQLTPKVSSSSSALSSASSLSSVPMGRPVRQHLPSSGPAEVGMLAMTCLSMYTAAVHQRARRRSRA